ncbi:MULTISPECIES: DISARM system phospholipase D-like protein DrmC [Actinomadura]|uniref:phospholipase D n=1 Tax=Actinomadura madurae TaxID=1993 RepID=A0A1I5XZS4_9ACTN|nr:DISARM system phospholipase D-like protein DrmC [Actinomadura madurae]SFQ37360.1 PLD-like domain-containing protein [Actinomadura madurae]SPT50059.1 nuclease NucT [Actinomadura madurae]
MSEIDDEDMTILDRLEEAAREPAVRIGPENLRVLAELIDAGRPTGIIRMSVPGFEDEVNALIEASWQEDLSLQAAAAYLRGVAAGLEKAAVQVEPVWSGPTEHKVPVRATAQVLSGLVGRSRHELLLMTYSAKPYEPLREALAEALRRGVVVRVVVETLQGAGSAISGEEPAAAFHGLGVELWHWPVTRRPDEKGRMHAKIAVADRAELFVSSANLTQSGVNSNIEAGLLIRGGTAPERAAEHFDALRAAGTLERL